MYCGDMVQGRSRIKSYKVHIQEQVPEEEWTIVKENINQLLTGKLLIKFNGYCRKTLVLLPKMTPYICSAVSYDVQIVKKSYDKK